MAHPTTSRRPPATATRRHARRRRLNGGPVITVLVAAVLSAVYYHHAFAAPTRTWIGDIGDPEQMMWFLAWVPHALGHGRSPLVGQSALFPAGENLMWNTSIILPSFLMAPVTELLGPVFSYNLLIALAPVFSAGAAYLAFARYVRSRVAAGVGALAFAFCPFAVRHAADHPQLELTALMPVLFLLLDEILVRQRWRPWVAGGLLGAAAAVQVMTGEELLTIEVLAGVVAVLALVILHPRSAVRRLGYAVRAAIPAGAVFVLLAGYPLDVQYRGPRRPVGVIHSPSVFESDLANLLQPVGQRLHLNIVGRPLAFSGNPTEWTGYLGFFVLAVVVVVVARNLGRRPVVAVALVLFVVFTVFSLGPSLHVNGRVSVSLPWDAAIHLPVLDQILPGRLSVVVDLAAALLLAVFVDDVVASRRTVPVLTGSALSLAALISWIPSPASVSTLPIPAFFTTSAVDQLPVGSVAVLTPYAQGPDSETTMLWQAVSHLRFRMVDGWLIVPGAHQGPTTVVSTTLVQLQTAPVAVTTALRTAFLAQLAQDQVDDVIVGPGPGQANEVQFLTALLGPGRSTGGVDLWRVPARS